MANDSWFVTIIIIFIIITIIIITIIIIIVVVVVIVLAIILFYYIGHSRAPAISLNCFFVGVLLERNFSISYAILFIWFVHAGFKKLSIVSDR